MLTKNQKGQILKDRIISEMKLDENSIRELGFRNKDDFENKLTKFKTKDKGYEESRFSTGDFSRCRGKQRNYRDCTTDW